MEIVIQCKHAEGPLFCSFRSTSITAVVSKSKASWSKILADKIPVPCTVIREYDDNGDFLSLRNVNDESHNDSLPLDDDF